MSGPAVDQIADRAAKSDVIVNSPSSKRLIVAGPGTGKSFTFRRALSARGGAGLALTFIRSLVADLKADLGAMATVDTYHGYCKGQLHAAGGGGGIPAGFRLYPELLTLVGEDLSAIGDACDRQTLEDRMHNLDNTNGLVDRALARAAFYEAVSFVDSVYRLVRVFDANPAAIPTYPLVVVDEYQDFSLLETKLIEQLGQKSYLLIAGDDDQALYARKQARPDYIRALANGGSFDVFDLPYCSRCTEVVVRSVNRVIARAGQLGLLQGRLDKPFEPFPGNAAASAAHPQIIHADCSIQTNPNPYVARYVEEQIGLIPAADIAESYAGNRPTVLVIGPSYFVSAVGNYLIEQDHQVELRIRRTPPIDIAEGYRLLTADANSNLGWRIVHAARPCDALAQDLSRIVSQSIALGAEFCANCAADHLVHIDLVRKVLLGTALSTQEEGQLRARLDESGDLAARLAGWSDEQPAPTFDQTRPRTICTSLVGSKGLSADYVFVVGMNNDDFPRNAAAITDTEVCEFVVALSRTRKECHLVSCRRFGYAQRSPSSLIGWLGDAVAYRWIDKSHWP